MKLSGIKARSEAFKHPFYELPILRPLEEDEKPMLILRIKDGDLGAAHLVILSHIRLSLSIVGRYIGMLHNKSKSDDLVSAAVEGLVHAVNKIREEGLPHNNLTGYLTENVHRFISECLEHTPVVRVPARTQRHKRTQGEAIEKPVVSELTETVIEAHFDRRINTTSELELREILEKIIESPTERTIIESRVAGYKDADIANQIGLSHTTVFLIRRELEKRFISLFGDD